MIASICLQMLLLSFVSLATAEGFLVGSVQDLVKRDDIVQGWALVEDNCPQGTGGCGARSCCPLGSYCDTGPNNLNSNTCCPTRK
jgi:hypothetical protein